jgi:hypothetical protein
VNADLGGLLPGNEYQVWLTVTNSEGTREAGPLVFTTPVPPEIAVEQAGGAALTDDVGSVSFGLALTGATVTRTFTIRNTGGTELTGLAVTFHGTDAADFTVASLPASSVPPGESTSFTVRFAPLSAGTRTAALQLASNDEDESPFDITLSGRALAPQGDDDNDRITNIAELNLATLGFDPLVDSSALRALLHDNRAELGLYRASDIQTLAQGQPVIELNRATGTFQLVLSVEKSPNMSSWSPLTGYTPSYDPVTGRIVVEFAPSDSATQFFRVLGGKP